MRKRFLSVVMAGIVLAGSGVVDRLFPSSKRCSRCSYIKKDLKLSDRIFNCHNCGLVIDRDYNASLNIRDCKDYRLV